MSLHCAIEAVTSETSKPMLTLPIPSSPTALDRCAETL